MAEITRTGSAQWNGSLAEGEGWVSTGSAGVHEVPYSAGSRFENAAGTNPEELIAAAQASCFTMALAKLIEEAGYKELSANARAGVTVHQSGDSFRIGSLQLEAEASVPGMDEAQFQQLAEKAKESSPVSVLLRRGLDEFHFSARLTS